jgi:hypothetical protein
MARHFSVDRATINTMPDRELGLSEFTRRWSPHILAAEQKLRRATESQSPLTILASLAEKNIQGMIAGDESWLAYLIESEVVFAFSPAEVTPRV